MGERIGAHTGGGEHPGTKEPPDHESVRHVWETAWDRTTKSCGGDKRLGRELRVNREGRRKRWACVVGMGAWQRISLPK